MARIPKKIPTIAVVKKVRFSLPLDSSASDDDIEEEKPPNESDNKKPSEPTTGESKVHGTAKYVNGTLNLSGNDGKSTPVESKAPPKKEKKAKKAKGIVNVTTFPRSALASNSHRPIESPVCSDYWTKAFNGCKVVYGHSPSHSESSANDQKKNRRPTRIRSCTTILFSPTKCIRRSACFRNVNKKKIQRLPNELKVPPPHSARPRPRFSARKQFIRLFTRPKIASKPNQISMQEINERISLLHLYDPIHQPSTIDPINPTKAVLNDFEHRWSKFHYNRLKCSSSSSSGGGGGGGGVDGDGSGSNSSTFMNATTNANHLVDYRAFEKSDANNIHCIVKKISGRISRENLKMNIQKIPLITTLLRASRNQDEEIIRHVLASILNDGITPDDLNATDCSGRTALSYMCSTNVIQFLEILLHAPGIDINKPDVELNTPLHYAAECGQIEAICMLLQQNKIQVDAKNVFGFTPLMKAAIQGHTRCAKALLLAGASPTETDYKRQLRAEQWAKFVGRHSCAEAIGKCSRSRNPDKEKLPQVSNDTSSMTDERVAVKVRARANSAIQTTSKMSTTTIVTTSTNKTNSDSSSIRSKLSKVFNFVSRDKSNQMNMNNNNFDKKNGAKLGNETNRDFIVFGNASPLHKNSHTMMSRSDGFLNKSLMRPLEVPKVEVTSPHNQELIRKYEKRYSLGNTDPTKPPALPPRRSSKIMF